MLNKRLLYSAYRIATMHHGPDGSSKEIHGTAFLLKSQQQLYAVTNKHNLQLSFKDEKYVGYTLEDFQISGYSDGDHYYDTTPNERINFAFPDNPAEDVVVLDLTGRKMQYRRRRKASELAGTALGAPSFFAIELGMLAAVEDLKRLPAGAAIFMPSYSLLYDKSSERPVMRAGVVSSDPESDYLTDELQPARRVLFQAQSADGASGAPVFALIDEEAILLGVNAGQLKLGVMPSSFSYCFKSLCIRECIEKLERLRLAESAHHQTSVDQS